MKTAILAALLGQTVDGKWQVVSKAFHSDPRAKK